MSSLVIGEDFPMVCEACLGPNPYVRMTKVPNGTECKISKRPCTLFEWRTSGVKKATCVAYAVAAQKNICQVCMTDLTFGLPVAVRDAFLKAASEKGADVTVTQFPKSRVGQDYLLNQQLAKINPNDTLAVIQDESEKAARAIHSMISAVKTHSVTTANTNFQFQLPKLCHDWVVNGQCDKERCTDRPCCGAFKFPEIKNEQKLSALIEELKENGAKNVVPSSDVKEILLPYVAPDSSTSKNSKDSLDDGNKTIFVSNLQKGVTEDIVRNTFARFKGVKRVSLISDDGPHPYAFVEFSSHAFAKFVVQVQFVQVGKASAKIAWAKSTSTLEDTTTGGEKKKRKANNSSRREEEEEDNTVEDGEGATPNEQETKKLKSDLSSKHGPPPKALLEALNKRKQKGLE